MPKIVSIHYKKLIKILELEGAKVVGQGWFAI